MEAKNDIHRSYTYLYSNNTNYFLYKLFEENEMTLKELEEKLQELQRSIPEDQEVYIKAKDFDYYLISSYGNVKSLPRAVYRKRPRGKKFGKYIYKGKILTPLYTGKDHRWLQVRLTGEKNEWRQVSIAKLMISSFMDIPFDELPHGVYFLNLDSSDLRFHNLTFIRKKTGR